MLVLLVGVVCFAGVLVLLRGRVSRSRAAWIAGVYLAAASFTIIGNPFARDTAVTIPVFGILMTLPWSVVAGRFTDSFSVALEVCAVLNAFLLYVVLGRRDR